MGFPWVRLESAFPRHPKVLALLAEKDGHRTAFVYVCGLAYAGEHGTDGYLPKTALPFLHGRPADAARLVRVRLWHEDVDGWLINDWADFQPSARVSAAIQARAAKGAAARWEGHGEPMSGAERTARYRARQNGSDSA